MLWKQGPAHINSLSFPDWEIIRKCDSGHTGTRQPRTARIRRAICYFDTERRRSVAPNSGGRHQERVLRLDQRSSSFCSRLILAPWRS